MSPGKFHIVYKTPGDLKVFVSKQCREPDEKSYQHRLTDPQAFYIRDGKDPYFRNEFIYFSFYSFLGCSISLTIGFRKGKVVNND
jgi:hypothetical protein